MQYVFGILINNLSISSPTVSTPTFNPGGGNYTSSQAVTISTTTSGASIYYTTDGNVPTQFSYFYSGAIFINTNKTIKAIGIKSGYNDSDIASATYTINIDTGSSTRQNLIFTSTFDDASPFSNFYSPMQVCCTYSIDTSNEQAYIGSKSMKVQLYKTDSDVAGSKRAEVVPLDGDDPVNAERWFGAVYYFPSASYLYDGSPESILQWHHNSSTGSPPLAIWTWQDQFYVTRVRQVGTGYQSSYYSIDYIPKDQWVSIVVHYNQRADANGKIEVWINDVKVYDEDGIVAFDGVSNYLKFGIYKWPWKNGGWGQTETVTYRMFYIDEVRYGNENATYYDVAPGNY